MKPFPFILFLTTASIFGQTAPEVTSAAKVKPSSKWEDYPTRLVSSLADYKPTTDGERSTYGGLKSGKHESTGFFHAKKTDKRWWLIDPEGYPFIHVGVVSVSPPRGKNTPPNWGDVTSDLLHDHGFNGTGAWSENELIRKSKRPVVYTKIWNFMSSYGHKRGGMYQKSGHMGYPGDCIFVFDPQFEAFCDEYAKRLVSSKDDPWLLGHFSDNELPFYHKSLDNFMKLPKTDPGRKAVDKWLTERRKRHPEDKTLHDGKRQEFLGYLAERYLKITTAAIRKYDPNHLCLGPRFDHQALQSKPLFEAAGRHLDVIAANYYHQWSPNPEQVKNWVEWSGKPFIVTEWYAKGMDSGFANTSGAGFVVKTQADRGRFYQNFTLGLLESGGCVGWHWFKYRDNDPNDKGADPSNIDSNKGIVTLGLEPYVPLMQAMHELNRQVYSLADYFDRKRQVAP